MYTGYFLSNLFSPTSLKIIINVPPVFILKNFPIKQLPLDGGGMITVYCPCIQYSSYDDVKVSGEINSYQVHCTQGNIQLGSVFFCLFCSHRQWANLKLGKFFFLMFFNRNTNIFGRSKDGVK